MRSPNYPLIALSLGLTGSQVLAFIGETPSHALKDPVNVPPIRVEEFYPHLRKRDEDWSRFHLQDEVKLLWAHGNQNERVIFDMDIQKPDQKHPLLALEELDTFTESIECHEPKITLKFRSEEAIHRAEQAWSWINRAHTDYFYMIANHDGCGPDAMRHPYKVVSVKHNNNTLTTEFTTQNADWEEVTPNHKMSIGTSNYARPASRYDASAQVALARRAAIENSNELQLYTRDAYSSGWDNLIDSFKNFPLNFWKGFSKTKEIPKELVDAGVTFVDGLVKIPGEVGHAASYNINLASGFVISVAEDVFEDIKSDVVGGGKFAVKVVEKLAEIEETLAKFLMSQPLTFDFASTPENKTMKLYPPITIGPVEFSSECQDCSTKGSLTLRATWVMNGGSLLDPVFHVETKRITGSLPIKHKVSIDIKSTDEEDLVVLVPVPGITPFTIGAVSIGPMVLVGGGIEGKLKVAGAFTTKVDYKIPNGKMDLHPNAPGKSQFTGYEKGLDFNSSLDIEELNIQAEASYFVMARLGVGLEWGKGTTVGAWADFKAGMKGTLKIGALDKEDCPAEFFGITGVAGDTANKVNGTPKKEGKTTGGKVGLSPFYEISVAAGVSVGNAKVSFKVAEDEMEVAGLCFTLPWDSTNLIKQAIMPPPLALLQSLRAKGKIVKNKAEKYTEPKRTKGQMKPGMLTFKGKAPQIFKPGGGSRVAQAVIA
ncbi:hypothetical protein H072_1016 [Dactylellina haptotyla CBS 200.50]|uniref:DUF7029 domain-containing protein n=1 Tax=Dactylellina haptotyla (strain CBS 200.50) TaxID=1284197 RepID=S8BZU9_DACHA|nr:hypothetical protein H072_1016 [Dactylellina haptotyla CBS 200.50]